MGALSRNSRVRCTSIRLWLDVVDGLVQNSQVPNISASKDDEIVNIGARHDLHVGQTLSRHSALSAKGTHQFQGDSGVLPIDVFQDPHIAEVLVGNQRDGFANVLGHSKVVGRMRSEVEV